MKYSCHTARAVHMSPGLICHTGERPSCLFRVWSSTITTLRPSTHSSSPASPTSLPPPARLLPAGIGCHSAQTCLHQEPGHGWVEKSGPLRTPRWRRLQGTEPVNDTQRWLMLSYGGGGGRREHSQEEADTHCNNSIQH